MRPMSYSAPETSAADSKAQALTDILLIDDSLTDLRLLMELMTARRLRVSVAFDGEKGYQQALLQQPALILLDVRMPGLDGLATCRRLKANPATCLIPVIFLTAATDLAERLEGFALGGVDYIGKPFDETEVLARVSVHLRLAPKASAPGALEDVPAADGSMDAVLVAGGQKILRQTLSNPPSLEGLAHLLGTNRRRLNEAFQARCALPVFGWLREERLRQAHYLVGSTETPISQIGEYLGFSTPTNFAKAFRERFACPPRVLRLEMQMARQKAGPCEDQDAAETY